MPLNENKQFWEQAWAEGRTRFHRPEANWALTQYAPTLFAPGDRVLVPLCGKSVDLLWLSERGHGVVGVELAKQPILEFIAENQLEGSWSDHCFQTKGQRLSVCHQDFFLHDGRYEAIYDRASLVALPQELRARMAERYRSLLMPGGKILLVTLIHPSLAGPPYSVNEEEVFSLFSQDFDIEFLDTRSEGERIVQVRKLTLKT